MNRISLMIMEVFDLLHFGLIGEHLGHSLSVPIHQALYTRLGLDADYRLIEIPKADLQDRVFSLFQELDGFNITIPYKTDVIPMLSSLDHAAESMGAVNTVDCANRKGYNTDAPGFAAMLRHHGMDVQGKPCFVLGTGGASKAVVAALKDEGASSITLVSRTPREGVISYDQLAGVFSGYLINCTPAGMWPKVEGCPISKEVLSAILPHALGVADVIYNPPETCLTLAAKEAGIPACTGLYMLVAQAVVAESIWLKQELPENLPSLLMKDIEEMKLL